MLEVNRLAGLHGITFRSIRSEAPVPANAYMVHPFEVVLEGRFANVSAFLGDLRKLVRVKKDVLDVRGRLFAVDTLALSKPDGKKTFPTVKATVTLDAFDSAAPAGTPAPSTTDGSAMRPPRPARRWRDDRCRSTRWHEEQPSRKKQRTRSSSSSRSAASSSSRSRSSRPNLLKAPPAGDPGGTPAVTSGSNGSARDVGRGSCSCS